MSFDCHYRRTRPGIFVAVLMGCAALGLSQSGCESSAPAKPESVSERKDPEELSADEILQAMVAAYRKADSYEDSGEMRIEQVQGENHERSGPIPLSVALERPNRLRLHAFSASVVVNDDGLRATVAELGEQVLALDVGAKLTTELLTVDPNLAAAISGGPDFGVPQLELLVGSAPLKEIVPGGKEPKRLDDKDLDGQSCHRVQIVGAEGPSVLWIDPESHILRRIDFPTAAVKEKFDPMGNLTALNIWAEFKGAKLNPEIPREAFQFEVPDGAKLVRRFVQPGPESPPEFLGKQPDDFSFVDLGGTTVDQKTLEGKVVVLDVWATWCGWCFRSFPNLEKVYQEYKDNDKVAFLAVNTDTPDVSDEQVRESFEKPGYNIPIVRDPEDYNRSVFNVEGIPAMFILGADGTVQGIHMGYDPKLANWLPKKIETLLKGDDLAKEVWGEYEAKRREYEQRLSEVLISSTTVLEVPQVEIAAKTEPESFKLTQLWSCKEVSKPGNLLVVDRDDELTILVVDDSRVVVELGSDGSVSARHELGIPETLAVSYLRTAENENGGRYFAAFASTQQQLYLFDPQWKLLLKYPDSEHAGIWDVQFGDLNGDGQTELNVGYWGVVGVQNVSLDGQRLWSNRSLENVLGMAVSGPDEEGRRRVLCVNGTEAVVPIDHEGQPLPEIRVADRPLQAIVAADLDGTSPEELCVISAQELGATVAVGIDATGAELWSYDLPRGLHQQPISPVTAGRLDADGPLRWLIPAPDGSIHVIAADGTVVDKFNYGETLTGLATAVIDGGPALLVSTPEAVTAWRVEQAE